MIKIVFILGLFLNFNSNAQEVESGFRAGPTMAVQEANLQNGFKLTEQAKKNIALKTKKIESSPYIVPAEALVYYGDKVGLYRLRDGWFKLIEIKDRTNKNTNITFNSVEFKIGDEVAIEGVALLRVSEMDAFGGEQ